jgi:Tol biopolymer transport system component
MDEQRLERALRQGPPFATRYVHSAVALDKQPVVRSAVGVGRLVLITAVTALLLVGLLGGLVALGMLQQDDRGASNGWIAFARYGSDRSAGEVERDIYLVGDGQPARRIIGSDSDGLDQICPAFSPDGRRLAHGEADGTADTGYRDAALVISDLDAAGKATESLRIDVGGTFPPPCGLWSADGRRVAFGVPATSPLNPDRTAAGSEVWVATVADGQVDVLPDMLATDLEWSPQGSELAIASGQTDLVGGLGLRDGSIRLYDADSGDIQTLVGPSGVSSLTWSPDGSRIAYQRGRSSDGDGVDQEIWVAQVDGSREDLLASGFASIHGIGPVWSPTGDRIAYQRFAGGAAECCSGEHHEVVLVTPDGASEVVLPDLRLPGDDASARWSPWRVTWSPDGRQLLYMAWSFDGPFQGAAQERTALISVPIDSGSDPAVLHEDANMSVYDDKGRAVPIQSWGRRPDDTPTPGSEGAAVTVQPSVVTATPAPKTETSSSAQPSPSPAPNDTSAWLPFVSDRYGFSIAYPPEWSAHPAYRDWKFPDDTAWPDGVEVTDWFSFEPPDDPSVAASAWSVALEPGTSADQWFLDYCAVEVTPCDGTELKVTASLDGHEGWLVLSSDPHAYFGIGDRIYLLAVWQPEDIVTLERYGGGRQFLEAFLSTMRLLPDQQSPAPSAP